jgi:hypothetical protein
MGEQTSRTVELTAGVRQGSNLRRQQPNLKLSIGIGNKMFHEHAEFRIDLHPLGAGEVRTAEGLANARSNAIQT